MQFCSSGAPKIVFFSGALIGIEYFFGLLSKHVFLKFVPLLQRKAAEDAARSAVHESSDTVRSRKAQCQAVPDNPETGGTVTRRGRGGAGEKIGNRAPKRIQSQLTAAATTTCHHHHDYHARDSKKHNYWVEHVRVASCCCFCSSVLLLS